MPDLFFPPGFVHRMIHPVRMISQCLYSNQMNHCSSPSVWTLRQSFVTPRKKENHPAEISYTDQEGNEIKLPIKIKVRGNFRKDPINCDFPPLRLNFSILLL